MARRPADDNVSAGEFRYVLNRNCCYVVTEVELVCLCCSLIELDREDRSKPTRIFEPTGHSAAASEEIDEFVLASHWLATVATAADAARTCVPSKFACDLYGYA